MMCLATPFAGADTDIPRDDSLLVPDWNMWTCHERRVLYKDLMTSICDIPGKRTIPGFVVWFEKDTEPVVVAWGYDTSLPTYEARWKNAHAALHLSDGRWIIGKKFMVTWANNGRTYTISLLDDADVEIAGMTFIFGSEKKLFKSRS